MEVRGSWRTFSIPSLFKICITGELNVEKSIDWFPLLPWRQIAVQLPALASFATGSICARTTYKTRMFNLRLSSSPVWQNFGVLQGRHNWAMRWRSWSEQEWDWRLRYFMDEWNAENLKRTRKKDRRGYVGKRLWKGNQDKQKGNFATGEGK